MIVSASSIEFRAEENPREADDIGWVAKILQRIDQPVTPSLEAISLGLGTRAKAFTKNEERPMDGTPDGKLPVRTVPDAAHEKDDQEIRLPRAARRCWFPPSGI